jgi:RNA polymerase sigma factor (sigma-70 family)
MEEASNKNSMENQSQIEELLEGYYTGDNVTVERFFLLFGDKLIHFANAILNDVSKAKDAVQDVMIKLLETPVELRREKFRPNVTNVLGALKMRVRNRSIDLIRQQNRHREVDIQTLFTLEGGDNSNTDFIVNDELKMAIRILEPLEREVLRSHLEGYNSQELEEMYPSDQSPRVLKQRIKRKLKREILRLRMSN